MSSALRAFFVVFCLCGLAHADLGLILSDPLPEGLAKWTQSGHSAVYLSNVCAESPVKLRLCSDGESGAVISNYSDFKENGRYEWNAAPFNMYFYGVDDAEARPLYASHELRLALQDRFRRRVLGDLCTTDKCLHDLDADWRDMVAESFVRGMYVFVVKTSADQDRRFVEEWNSRPNVNRYSGVSNNCANFALRVVNFYFPGAAHGNRLNDFGVVSPKAIARSFARFGHRHPQLDYRVIHIPQLPGDFPASSAPRLATEVPLHSKRVLLPMLLRPHILALFTTTYFLTGRFNPEKEFKRHSADDLGTAQDWDTYRAALREFDSSEPGESKAISIPRLAQDDDKHPSVSIDEDGLAWAEVEESGASRRVGLNAANVLSPDSDRTLAQRILLAKASAELKSPQNKRESLTEFKREWELLQESRQNLNRTASLSSQKPAEAQ